jgi:hypothetical protein
MKLICINAKPMFSNDGSLCCGDGLQEGDVYESLGKIDSPYDNTPCYVIKGLGLKICVRFKPADNDWVEELLARIKQEVEIEEFEFA